MIYDRVTRAAFAVASGFLMLLAFGLIAYAAYEVVRSLLLDSTNIATTLLEAVGYTVIAIAVFDVGKYLLEEEAIRAREMRQAAEARRSLTKFISTIAIAVFLEGLVAVFEAGKDQLHLMIYPTFLLLTGVALVIGLGIYQRLSAMVENETTDPVKPTASARRRTREPKSA
ncbi:GNAT family acetyltransferase [Phyllobacterium lublinensis]|uniref:GNAT family acetyltransferase n=1 Tax=Phyllobacterium lublinensis TaxID=2875708 RepID=UPI001CCE8AE1|nr:GNAT family acetyltransferase [Phyllobacterium sp. 2063]